MNNIFSPDSRFMAAMSLAADLVLLNVLFLVSCVPIVTIGAAYTALYKVVFSIGTKREGRAVREYFRAFRSDFVQATKVWLLLLFAGAALAADHYLLSGMFGSASILCRLILVLAAIELFVLSYAFPLVSFFDNTVMGTLKNAFFISIGNFPRTIPVVLMLLLPFFLYFRFPLIFFNTGFIWISVYFSATAYFSSLLLKKAISRFLPEDYFAQEENEE